MLGVWPHTGASLKNAEIEKGILERTLNSARMRRTSVGVPETLDGRSSGCTCLTFLSSIAAAYERLVILLSLELPRGQVRGPAWCAERCRQGANGPRAAMRSTMRSTRPPRCRHSCHRVRRPPAFRGGLEPDQLRVRAGARACFVLVVDLHATWLLRAWFVPRGAIQRYGAKR